MYRHKQHARVFLFMTTPKIKHFYNESSKVTAPFCMHTWYYLLLIISSAKSIQGDRIMMKKKWLKRSYVISKVEDIDTIWCLYLEIQVHCNVVSEGYYFLLQRESYIFKSEAVRYGTQWTKINVTCIKTKHEEIFLFTMQDVLKCSMVIPESGLLHWGLTYYVPVKLPGNFANNFKISTTSNYLTHVTCLVKGNGNTS